MSRSTGALLSWAVALALLAPGLASGAAEAESGPDSERARAERVARAAQWAAARPEDAPARWAHANALADAGRLREAEAELAHFERLAPERRAESALRRGRWLYELGDYERARAALVRSLGSDPDSGPAHLYLGLVFAKKGLARRAAREFGVAGELSPELAVDAALLGGLALLESGHEREGIALLERVIDLDPEGELARYAGLVLGERARRGDRVRVEVYSRLDYDSNVPLTSRLDLGGVPSDRDDGRASWGAWVSGRVIDGDRGTLTLGARYEGSEQFDLDRYDQQFVGLVAGLGWKFDERVRARLDASVNYSWLGGEPYVLYGAVVPSLFVGLGERWGVLRLAARVEPIDYEERPLFGALDRDGIGYGASLTQLVPLGALGPVEASRLSIGAGYWRLDTEGRKSPAPFDAAYDHDSFHAHLGVRSALPWQLEAELVGRIRGEYYDHRNVVGLLTSLEFERREDLVYEALLELGRPLGRHVDLELSYAFTKRDSNLTVYTYDRHVVGLGVRVHVWRWLRERNRS